MIRSFQFRTSCTALNSEEWEDSDVVFCSEVWHEINGDEGRSLCNNKEFALACVNKTYRSVFYLSDALQSDKEVVAAAVSNFYY